jgi:hypothetical protein
VSYFLWDIYSEMNFLLWIVDLTRLEHFSKEYFFEIFDYLDGYQIFCIFSNLNRRFTELLNAPSLLFRINLHDHTCLNKYKEFYLLHRHKILLMNVWSKYDYSLYPLDSSLIHLESIDLTPLEDDLLVPTLKDLTCPPRLFSLTLQVGKNSTKLNEIYQLLFLLPALKLCKFDDFWADKFFAFPMPTAE